MQFPILSPAASNTVQWSAGPHSNAPTPLITNVHLLLNAKNVSQSSKGQKGGDYPVQLKIYSVFNGAFPLIRIGQLTRCQRNSIGNKSKGKDHSLIEPAALGLHVNRRCLYFHLPSQSCSGPGRGCHTSWEPRSAFIGQRRETNSNLRNTILIRNQVPTATEKERSWQWKKIVSQESWGWQERGIHPPAARGQSQVTSTLIFSSCDIPEPPGLRFHLSTTAPGFAPRGGFVEDRGGQRARAYSRKLHAASSLRIDHRLLLHVVWVPCHKNMEH